MHQESLPIINQEIKYLPETCYLDGGILNRLAEHFLCLKNIRTFLKVCHDKFGLRNSELFDPFDLFDVRDFGKKEIQVDLPVFCIKRCLNIRPESMDMCWHVYHQLAVPDPENSGGITDSTWPGEV
ncbi:hypothetical protein NQZ68_014477 [Dissostichus eleginoides]|nr:hypothetical protein NQZ68_014477 [Dissostichus eleginoides]